MKKLVCLLISIFLTLSLFSCVDRRGSDDTTLGCLLLPPETEGQPLDPIVCEGVPEVSEKECDLRFRIDKESFITGETIVLTASLLNISGRDIKYTGYIEDLTPSVSVYPDGQPDKALSSYGFPAYDQLPQERVLSAYGRNRTFYAFLTDRNTPAGSYTVELTCGELKEIRPAAFSISYVDGDMRPPLTETDLYIESGSGRVEPRAFHHGSEIYDGDSIAIGCGAGAWMFFDDSDSYLHQLPLLVGYHLKANLPAGYSGFANYTLFNTENRHYYNISSAAAEDVYRILPAGDYIVSYSGGYDSRLGDETLTKYEKTSSDYLVRLLVPGYEHDTVEVFSYREDSAIYKAGEPGVRSEGFKNTENAPISSAAAAAERAKAELTVEYNRISVTFDPEMKIWKTVFWTLDYLGGGQTVYLNENGITQLVVYGE